MVPGIWQKELCGCEYGSWGMEMTLDHPGGPVKSQGPQEREAGGAESEKEMWRPKQRLSDAIAARSPKPRHASTSRRFKRLRNRPPPAPPEPPEAGQPCPHLVSAQGAPCQTAGLQHSELLHLYCFKPLGLWCFAAEAIRN